MSRPNEGPRLYLRKGRIKAGKELPARYFIRDGQIEIGTGFGDDCREEAKLVLARYRIEKSQPAPPTRDEQRDPDKVLIATVLALYAEEKAPFLASDPASTAGFIKALLGWWRTRPLSDVKRSTCSEYVAHRTSQVNSRAKGGPDAPPPRAISSQTARRELEVLSAAIGFWDGEHKLTSRPLVTLPDRPESPRDALTRAQGAALLKASLGWRKLDDGSWKRLGPSQRANRSHLRRAILIQLYTGSRPGVTRNLLWSESPTHPWVDLDRGVIFRRGRTVREKATKRTPMVKIPPRLLAHLRRWRRIDLKREMAIRQSDPDFVLNSVIHHGGAPLAGKIRTSFENTVADAGLDPEVTPHWLRHTAATWLMEAGCDMWKAAAFLGMTVQTLEKHYAHHRPDYQEQAAGSIGGRR